MCPKWSIGTTLPFCHTVNIDIGADAIFHAFRTQFVLRLFYFSSE